MSDNPSEFFDEALSKLLNHVDEHDHPPHDLKVLNFVIDTIQKWKTINFQSLKRKNEMRHIAAYTEKQNDYPAFVNISQKEPVKNQINPPVQITVRSQGDLERIGDMAMIEMPLDDFASFIIEAVEFMAGYVPKDPNQGKLDV